MKLVVGLHHACLDSNKEKFQDGEVGDKAFLWESQGGEATNGASL